MTKRKIIWVENDEHPKLKLCAVKNGFKSISAMLKAWRERYENDSTSS